MVLATLLFGCGEPPAPWVPPTAPPPRPAPQAALADARNIVPLPQPTGLSTTWSGDRAAVLAEGEAQVLNTISGQLLTRVDALGADQVALSTDGSRLGLAATSGTTWIHDAQNGQLLAQFQTRADLMDLALGPQASWIATLHDGSLAIWTAEGEPRHAHPVTGRSLTQDVEGADVRLAVWGADGGCAQWDPPTGQVPGDGADCRNLGPGAEDEAGPAISSPGGERSFMGGVLTEQPGPGVPQDGGLQLGRGLPIHGAGFAVGGAGLWLITPYGLEPWRLGGDEVARPLQAQRSAATAAQETGRRIREIGWSPDGRRVLAAWDQGVVQLWDLATDRVHQVLIADHCEVDCRLTAAGFSMDGGEVWASYTTSAWVWDSDDGDRLRRVELSGTGIRRLADGGWMGLAGDTVIRWDDAGREVDRQRVAGTPTGLVLSPSGQVLVTGAAGQLTFLRGQGVVHTAHLPARQTATGGAWSLTEDRIALTTGADVLLVDPSSGQVRRTLPAQEAIRQVGFHSAGDRLLLADRILRAVHPNTGQELSWLQPRGVGHVSHTVAAPRGHQAALVWRGPDRDTLWIADLGASSADP